ncbi:HesB/IscA family protein [Reinekea blandensis]|uniref:Fe-S cluster assembly scaffold protein n=1 Tax=Reinekea blandensis MED297 TaxID=314283 RepID=A4BH33_9GAMM|nr:iron-sulfur cluster assembly accessory protein [Reinekea blandensis]EAR08532.1 Fe-S cluster assembly scaffold protein [Reinekea sp. MED297] [Reinekea blandensis MED297]
MTVNSFDPQSALSDLNVTMTDAAVRHFQKQLQTAGLSSVRLFLEESGCSGYMYRVELVDEASPGDVTVPVRDDLTLFVADDARAIIQGTEIDFKKDGLNELIKFNNPNVTAECGCGESFVVEND